MGSHSDFEDDEVFDFYGVTHRLIVKRLPVGPWPFVLSVSSPSGTGQAVMSRNEVDHLVDFLRGGEKQSRWRFSRYLHGRRR